MGGASVGPDEFAASLRGIREARQRIARLVEHLAGREPDEIARFLKGLTERSADLNDPRTALHLDLTRFRDSLEVLGYELLAHVYGIAAREGWAEVMLLFRSDRRRAGSIETKPGGFAGRLNVLTLGERKQMSRQRRRSALEMLIWDADPAVIRELLLNPKVVERDVVRIASRHQAPSTVLEEVLRSDRWMSRYAVRKALAFNPRTPRAPLPGLIRHLRKGDLRLLVAGGRHDPEILAIARGCLAPQPGA
jgi:hypothetical protein